MPEVNNPHLNNYTTYIKKEFEKILPIWGVLSTIVLFISFGISSYTNQPQADISFFVIGLFLFASTVYILLKANKSLKNDRIILKNKVKQLRKISGDKIKFDDFNNKYPDIEKIGLIGRGGVGKTTLIENICDIPNSKKLSSTGYAYVNNFSKKYDKYAAMFDITGQSQSLQHKIALASDILIILIDHNRSEEDSKIDDRRLEEQSDFLERLLEELIDRVHKPKWIYFLLNKEDLWEKLSKNEQARLKRFFFEEVRKFKKSGIKSIFAEDMFSNEKTNHRTKLTNKIAVEIL